MTKRLNHERKLAFKSCHRLRASVFEVDAPTSDQHFIIRAIGQVHNFRGHLSREAKQICCPRAFRHDLPTLSSSYRLRSLVNIWTQLPAQRGIDSGDVIEAAPNAPDFSTLSEAREGDIDNGSAGDVQEILSREGFPRTEMLNPCNFLIMLGLRECLCFDD